MADAAPAPVPETPATPAAAPVSAEPEGTPPIPPAVKRASRIAQVREVVAKRAAEAPPVEKPAAEPAPANVDKEKPETKPEPAQDDAPKPEASKAKAWADVMERENKARQARDAVKREREQFAQERAQFEAERKAAQEASELLAKDPVAYAAKFGGRDFGKKLVDYTLDEKSRTVDQQAAKLAELESKFEQLTKAGQEREVQSRINSYLGEHRAHWKNDRDSAVLNSWYDDSEVEQVVRTIAERHATATQEVLTPAKLASNLKGELRLRLERLAKTEAGQEFLKQFIGTPAPAKTRPPAEAPKTLSKDLTTQGAPPGDGRLRKFSDKEKSDLLRRVVANRQG